MRRLIVAIDGPSGAGKSTVAKRLAKELGYIYMDTGAMYRALAWKVMREGTNLTDEMELKEILERTSIELKEEGAHLQVFLDGNEVTHEIRAPDVSQMASRVSAFKAVREKMVDLQRTMGSRGGVVAEGRDIGTVVFPGADVKIYLDASSGERARRRFEELKDRGSPVTVEETRKEMEERDRRDKDRAVAPLSKAEDAILIDSTHVGVDGVLKRIMQEIQNKIPATQ